MKFSIGFLSSFRVKKFKYACDMLFLDLGAVEFSYRDLTYLNEKQLCTSFRIYGLFYHRKKFEIYLYFVCIYMYMFQHSAKALFDFWLVLLGEITLQFIKALFVRVNAIYKQKGKNFIQR